VTALNDGGLQIEVMKLVPHNIEKVLSHDIIIEAYEQSLSCSNQEIVLLNLRRAAPGGAIVVYLLLQIYWCSAVEQSAKRLSSV